MAELQKQVIEIPFTAGRQTKLDKAIVKGNLLNLQNYSFNKNGTLSRRDAMVALNGTLTNTPMSELISYGSGMVAVDANSNLFSAVGQSSTTLVSGGIAPPFSSRKDEIRRSTGAPTNPDSATGAGVTLFAWIESSAVRYSILDETTGQLVVSNQVLAVGGIVSPTSVRACFVTPVSGAPVFFLVIPDTGTSRHWFATVSTSGTVVGSAFVGLLGSNAYTPLAEVAPLPGTSTVFVAWSSTSASASVMCAVVDVQTFGINSTPLVPPAMAALASLISFSVSPFSATNVGFVFAANTSTVYGCVVPISGGAPGSATFPSTFAVPELYSATLAPASGSVAQGFACGVSMAVQNTGVYSFSLNSSGVIASSGRVLTGTVSLGGQQFGTICSKAFLANGTAYVTVSNVPPTATSLQNSLFVIDQNGNVAAKALYGTAATPFAFSGYYSLASVPSPSASSFSIPALEQGTLSFSNGKQTTQAGVCRILLSAGRTASTSDHKTTPLWHAQAAGSIYFSGASPSFFDGVQTWEAGFLLFPEGLTTALGGNGGPAAGVHQYTAVYEFVDGQGRRHQSTPAPLVSQTTGNGSSGQAVVLTAPALLAGARAAVSSIVFYGTTAGGTTLYRINSVANAISPASGDASYTVTTSDAALAGNEPLYTQPLNTPTVLPNDAPSAIQAICAWQGRLVGTLAEDRYAFIVSQVEIPGVGLQWSQDGSMTFRIPRGYGELTGCRALDDKLVLFTPTNKFVFFGTGPDSTGANSSYVGPQILATDVGCIDQRSIALIPDVQAATGSIQGGLGHQTQHGYYMLSRALTDVNIGSPVEPDVTGHTVAAAGVLADKSQLRLIRADVGDELVFDYMFGQWSLFSGGVYRSCGCVFGGLWTVGDQVGQSIAQESIGSWVDTFTRPHIVGLTSPITGTIQTAWLRLGALSGFERSRRMVIHGSIPVAGGDSFLTLTVDSDYYETTSGNTKSTYSVQVQSTAANLLATGAGAPMEYRHHIQNQKGEVIRFTLVDSPNAGGGYAGNNYTGISLELGMKKGAAKLQAGLSV